jgi:hypothetical protein
VVGKTSFARRPGNGCPVRRGGKRSCLFRSITMDLICMTILRLAFARSVSANSAADRLIIATSLINTTRQVLNECNRLSTTVELRPR